MSDKLSYDYYIQRVMKLEAENNALKKRLEDTAKWVIDKLLDKYVVGIANGDYDLHGLDRVDEKEMLETIKDAMK